MLVAEDDPRAHGAPRLLAIDEDVITIHGHLGQTRSQESAHLYANGHTGGTGPKHER